MTQGKDTQGRDSKGHFIKGNVPWNKKLDISQREETAFVRCKKLIGGGAVKTGRVQVTCPACREQVEAITNNGRVKGYCTVANQYVDFRVNTRLVRER